MNRTESDKQLGQALGLRQLDINIKDIKKIRLMLYENSIELLLTITNTLLHLVIVPY